MSHEISQTLYDLAYWQRRAEQAEALARTLQAQRDAAEEIAEMTTAAANILKQAALAWKARALTAEADCVALRHMSDVSLRTYCGCCGVCHRCQYDLPVLNAEHPGALLLAELEAARRIVARARTSAKFTKRAAKGTIDADIAAYDAAVKARTE